MKKAIVLGVCLAAGLWMLKPGGKEADVRNEKQGVKPRETTASHGPSVKGDLGRINLVQKASDTSLDELRQQLDQGLDPNSTVNGKYLLTQAIDEGNADKVRLLLERGASITPPQSLSSVFATDDWLPIKAILRSSSSFSTMAPI
jgi:hypothetical protein